MSEVILYKQQIDEKYFTHFHPQRMDEFKNNMLHALIDGPLGYIAKEIIHKPLGSVILHCTTSFILFFSNETYTRFEQKNFMLTFIFFLYVFNN